MKRGFTLLEFLVVAGVLSIVSLVIAQVFFTTTRSNKKTESVRDIKQNGDQVIEIMNRVFQNSLSVSASSCPEQSATPVPINTITVSNNDGGQTTFLCLFDETNDVYRIASSSSNGTIFLTNANMTLIDPATKKVDVDGCSNKMLSFTCAASAGIPNTVSIAFTLRQKNEQSTTFESATATFQTNVTLRNK